MEQPKTEVKPVLRDDHGRLLPGTAGVPGCGRKPSHWSDLNDRVEYLSSKYSIEDLRRFMTDYLEFDKLSTRDAMIVRNLAHAAGLIDDPGVTGLERERIYDRMLGKPLQRQQHGSDPENPLKVDHTIELVNPKEEADKILIAMQKRNA